MKKHANPLCSWFLFCVLFLVICSQISWAEANEREAITSIENSDPGSEASTSDIPGEVESKAEKRGYRLLPIPIIITEPAIGDGLGLTLALFHPVKEGKANDTRIATPDSMMEVSDTRSAPPVVTAVMGAYTNNDTWMAGLGHLNNWRNDSIRYAGAIASAKINSQIYLLGRPLGFSMESGLIYQDVKFRLGQSDFMLGAGFVYQDARNRFGRGLVDIEGDDRFSLDFKNVGLAAKMSYDTRDNSTNPTDGQLVDLSFMRYDESIGGSFNYWSWKTKALVFRPLSDKLTLGLRFELMGVMERPPFFAYPFVKLRGIPALRYQDKMAGAVEIEGRYLLAPRWEVSTFAGLGYTGGNVALFENPDSIYNFGVGGRYKIFEAHNIWMGLDIARGPEDWNWYVQVGQAW